MSSEASAGLLSEIALQGAKLSFASLVNADLSGAFLGSADLSGAFGSTNEELEQQAGSLEGATMPNGQKYEDWLKDREARGAVSRKVDIRNGSERSPEKAE